MPPSAMVSSTKPSYDNKLYITSAPVTKEISANQNFVVFVQSEWNTLLHYYQSKTTITSSR